VACARRRLPALQREADLCAAAEWHVLAEHLRAEAPAAPRIRALLPAARSMHRAPALWQVELLGRLVEAAAACRRRASRSRPSDEVRHHPPPLCRPLRRHAPRSPHVAGRLLLVR
jgi:non-ribosomal peptide synthetase component F